MVRAKFYVTVINVEQGSVSLSPVTSGSPENQDVIQELDELQQRGAPLGRGWKNRAIQMYRDELLTRQMADPVAFDEWLEPLRGKDLACWCSLDQPCHADVLLELCRVDEITHRRDKDWTNG